MRDHGGHVHDKSLIAARETVRLIAEMVERGASQ